MFLSGLYQTMGSVRLGVGCGYAELHRGYSFFDSHPCSLYWEV